MVRCPLHAHGLYLWQHKAKVNLLRAMSGMSQQGCTARIVHMGACLYTTLQQDNIKPSSTCSRHVRHAVICVACLHAEADVPAMVCCPPCAHGPCPLHCPATVQVVIYLCQACQRFGPECITDPQQTSQPWCAAPHVHMGSVL